MLENSNLFNLTGDWNYRPIQGLPLITDIDSEDCLKHHIKVCKGRRATKWSLNLNLPTIQQSEF